jgi:4-methylaminobutanoate oxidase (formaldehyde-forming)
VKRDGGFIGAAALADEPQRRLRCLTLADPVRWRSATSRCGSTARCSGASPAAATATRSSAYAYLPAEIEPGAAVEVDIFGQWVAGEVAVEPLFDPVGERIRA